MSFFTDFGVPIVDSICFSITNGDKEVIGFSESFDFTTRNLAKLSTGLKTVEMLFSSSESGRCRLFFALAREDSCLATTQDWRSNPGLDLGSKGGPL